MIQVQFMKPFYTKLNGSKLRLVFAYQYFSITKDDEIFHFIPIEGKEMIVDLNTLQVENLSEVFVFQRGNRFVRLPLYQLLLVSNVHDHLMPIIENVSTHVKPSQAEVLYKFDEEVEGIVRVLEEENLSRLIDNALEARNEALFHTLMAKKAKLTGGFAAS
ncbi:IDEAL domain-containing protein [Solibacillus sp. MA9]|uniref:IDEAL domain-containing protein n=1 Tax=Solibacillus palustris TaxID=2908203 RepID=A0ABS9U8E0_9BACL|nr:IDEAL domain-containing protein [Solibacillus sp. MA9]MCH7320591.1 IDEAL domain-containing protein [Solibacillus sp. MA9]